MIWGGGARGGGVLRQKSKPLELRAGGQIILTLGGTPDGYCEDSTRVRHHDTHGY